MWIDLTHTRPRAVFLALVLAVSGMLTFLSARAFLAAHWNASANPELWLKAARLEPGNAEYWRRLGVLQQWEGPRNHGRLAGGLLRAADAQRRRL